MTRLEEPTDAVAFVPEHSKIEFSKEITVRIEDAPPVQTMHGQVRVLHCTTRYQLVDDKTKAWRTTVMASACVLDENGVMTPQVVSLHWFEDTAWPEHDTLIQAPDWLRRHVWDNRPGTGRHS